MPQEAQVASELFSAALVVLLATLRALPVVQVVLPVELAASMPSWAA